MGHHGPVSSQLAEAVEVELAHERAKVVVLEELWNDLDANRSGSFTMKVSPFSTTRRCAHASVDHLERLDEENRRLGVAFTVTRGGADLAVVCVRGRGVHVVLVHGVHMSSLVYINQQRVVEFYREGASTPRVRDGSRRVDGAPRRAGTGPNRLEAASSSRDRHCLDAVSGVIVTPETAANKAGAKQEVRSSPPLLWRLRPAGPPCARTGTGPARLQVGLTSAVEAGTCHRPARGSATRRGREEREHPGRSARVTCCGNAKSATPLM